MQKMIKRRLRPYLHPAGMTLRGYQDERFVSAPADGTSYVNPTPPLRIDQAHVDAMVKVAMDTGEGALSGAAAGGRIAGPAGMETGAQFGAATAAVKSIWTNCVTCHRK